LPFSSAAQCHSETTLHGRVYESAFYTLASITEAVRAALHYLQAYDWDVLVASWLADDVPVAMRAAELNAHFGHLRGKEKASSAQPVLYHAFELAQAALHAAQSAAEVPEAALFDWTQLPNVALQDIQPLLISCVDALEV